MAVLPVQGAAALPLGIPLLRPLPTHRIPFRMVEEAVLPPTSLLTREHLARRTLLLALPIGLMMLRLLARISLQHPPQRMVMVMLETHLPQQEGHRHPNSVGTHQHHLQDNRRHRDGELVGIQMTGLGMRKEPRVRDAERRKSFLTGIDGAVNLGWFLAR